MGQTRETDMEEAKAYLRKRLEAERSMSARLEALMQEAAREIIALAYKYNLPPSKFRFSADPRLQREVDEVVRRLKSQILETTCMLAVAGRTDGRDDTLAYINRESHGKTLAERNAIYCNRFKFEVEAAAAAGLILGIPKDETARSAVQHFQSPYANPYVMEAMHARSPATRLASNGISYGSGRTNSMFTALDKLTNFAVAEGWMRHWWNMGNEKGAKGFITFRGSSYPCTTCSEYAMRVHDMSEPYPPLHLRCKCGMAFVY